VLSGGGWRRRGGGDVEVCGVEGCGRNGCGSERLRLRVEVVEEWEEDR